MSKMTLLLSTSLFTLLVCGPTQAQEPAVPSEPGREVWAELPEFSELLEAAETPAQRTAAPPVRPSDRVSLNFSRADLVEVIHVLAQHLRLNYTIDPEVKGSVTIHSAEPLRREDLFPIFHQVLRMNGVVAVKVGELYRIAPIKEGKGLARPVAQGKEDQFALQIMPVRFFSVSEMKRLLAPFVTSGGEILDYPRGNFLIVVDIPSNIQRLMEIRDLIDVQVFAGTRMEIYQPKVASAEELAGEMTKIMQAFASSAAQVEGFAAQFMALPRINQLLVISHSEAAWSYVRRWLERIDSVGEGPGRRIFIYPVENGKATDLADILNQVLGIAPAVRREPAPTLQDLHRGVPRLPTAPGVPRPAVPPLGAPALGTGAQIPPLGAYAVTPAPAPAPAPPAVAPPAPVPPRPAVPTPPAEPRPAEQLRIVPDPATNSLIIYGTVQEFQSIKAILKDLDLMPRQVLLDVLVAEVTLADDLRFGVEYEIRRRRFGDEADVRIFDRVFGSRGSVVTGLPAPSATGLAPSALSAVIGTGNDFRAFINTLMGDSRVKVLSSPSVLATDNRPARIQVGTEEPIPTGTIVAAVGAAQPSSSTTIQYRSTGRILTIIPQVNSQGLVHLQIKAEVSQRGADVRVGQDSFPSFDTRDAETTAVVQDGETLVIGGIITDRVSRSRVGIPFLMDIPVLGHFFGTTTDDIDRTELLMLITPRVIRNLDDARSVTDEFKERLSTVTREIERMKRENAEKRKENDKSIPKKPNAPKPQVESMKESPGEKMVFHDEPSRTPDTGKLPETSLHNEGVDQAFRPAHGQTEVFAREEAASSVREVDENPAEKEAPAMFGRAKESPSLNPKESPVTKATETNKKLWTVQVAALRNQLPARKMANKLMDKGYNAYTLKAHVKGQILYRVRIGPLATHQEAKQVQETLIEKEKHREAFITHYSP